MITSVQNQQIRHIIALNKRAKYRREHQCYLVEGEKIFSELPKEEIRAVYVSERYLAQAEASGVGLPSVPFEVVSDKVFSQMSDTQNPQGILAVAVQKRYRLEDLLRSSSNPSAKPLLMILENIQDPGNLGTILRAGEGAGITGVLMSRGTADIYNSKVIRATMGSLFRVPFLYTDALLETVEELKAAGVRMYAAHLRGQCVYDEADYVQGTAFIIGNEAAGLSEPLSAQADCLVRIPMCGRVESLNAAVAASLLGFEAARQRRKGSGNNIIH